MRRDVDAKLEAAKAAYLAALEAQSQELREALVNIPAWLQAIHSRLSGLGAESIAPPLATQQKARRRLPRLRSAPLGYPIKPEDDDKGDP